MTREERELRQREAYGLLFLISLIWTGNFIAAKTALQVVGPITLSALRAVLATGVLLWYVRFTYQTWPSVGRADLRVFVVLALTGLVTNTTVWYYGLQRTLAINAAILGAMGPVFVTLLSASWLRERLSTRNVLGIVVSSAGVVLTELSWSAAVWPAVAVNVNNAIWPGTASVTGDGVPCVSVPVVAVDSVTPKLMVC